MLPVTAGVLEILVAGIEASIWIALIALSFAGPGAWRNGVPADWEAVVVPVYAGLCYGIGVLIDRLSDSAYSWFRKTRRLQVWLRHLFGEKRDFEPRDKIRVMRLRLAQADDGRAKFLEYQRSRIRIARATTFNLLLAVPAGAWFIAFTAELGTVPLVVFIVSMLAAAGFSSVATEHLGVAYVKALSEAYRQREKEGVGERDGGPDPLALSGGSRRAAAVCFRRRPEGEVEFLLVRTKERVVPSVERWTFPKGHAEPGECMRDAAAREAREEAGVEGRIECDAFTTYSYPSSHADSPPVTVDAFLLEVRRSSTHGESGRQPTWLLPDQAIAKLSENREARFGEEAERVIREAERKLVGSRS